MADVQAFVGRTYPPTPPYEVSRVKIAEFADALNDPNPAYRDPATAHKYGHADVIAPPTFAIVVSLSAGNQVLDDPELGIDYARVVHGEQRFEYVRPIMAGDVLQTTVTVESIRTLGDNDMITSRSDVTTADGERVVTTYTLMVVRGGIPGGRS